MIRKDYIQRYFDELAKVLAVVLQLKNDLRPTEAATKLNDFATDYLGISFEEILSLKKSTEIMKKRKNIIRIGVTNVFRKLKLKFVPEKKCSKKKDPVS